MIYYSFKPITVVHLSVDEYFDFQHNFIKNFGKNPSNNLGLNYESLKSILPVTAFKSLDIDLDKQITQHTIDLDRFKKSLVIKSISFTNQGYNISEKLLMVVFNVEFSTILSPYIVGGAFNTHKIIPEDNDYIKEYDLKL